MRELTPEGRQIVEDVAARHGVSATAARSLLEALAAGGGSQAQFDIPELGGMGQWSRGGMVMVGDMFNNALKARVDALATELAGLLPGALAPVAQSQSQGGAGASLFVTGSGGSWWPEALGTPASTGAQNDMRYAFFPQSRRLAIGRRRTGHGLRHRRPPHRGLRAAAVGGPVADLHQPARRGARSPTFRG